jgi:hypothetical protein
MTGLSAAHLIPVSDGRFGRSAAQETPAGFT